MSKEELNRRIAERAYFLFLERGCQHGSDLDDWIRAEKEIYASLQMESCEKPKTTRKRAAKESESGKKSAARNPRKKASSPSKAV